MKWSEFFQKSLQDGDNPSSSRWVMALAFVVAMFWVTYMLLKTHQWPDATVFGGLAAFCTSPYLVNRATVAYENRTTTQVNKTIQT